LSTLTSQLTTNSFLGTRTSVPDIHTNSVSNITGSFGSYSGNSPSGSVAFSYPFGNDPSLQAGPSEFQAWHHWATGGVQPPLALAPFGGQGFAATGPVYGTAGAYGALGYGSAGSYGAQGYGACSVYAGPPIFANYPQAPIPNYIPSTPGYPTQYGATPQQNYVPQPAYPQSMAQPYSASSANAQFNSWASDALTRFHASNAQISTTYQSSQSGYGQVSQYPAPPCGTGGLPVPNNQFDAWAHSALAQFHAQSAQSQSIYQGSPSYTAPMPPVFAPQQPAYGMQQGGYVDVTTRIPAFQQLPAYGSYQSSFQNLSTQSTQSYAAYNLGWSYPSQPAPYFQQALPSYTAPVLQTQTPYGYGGPPRPAPCAPPVYPPRPQPPAPQPAPYVPPTPPVTPPVAVQPQVIVPTPAPRTRIDYPVIPHTNNDPAPSAAALRARLTGDPNKIASFTSTNPPPIHNQDALRFDRIGAYFVMQQDSSLRYNVDTGKFFRTYNSGETKDVMDMAQVSQMLRQEHPDHYGRVGQLLGHLTNDDQLFGSRTPVASGTNPTRAHGATPINPGLVPPVQTPILPPFQQPTLPVFGGIPNSGGSVPALDRLVGSRQAGQISGNDFNVELIKIAAQTGALNNNPVQANPVQAPFTITAHRYWDSAAGAYSDVSEVMIQGGDNPNDVERRFNTNKQTSVVITKDGVPLGNPMRVTVTWENGQSRVWDYQVADQSGSDVDVFSPLG
jgi:hypothetical protein